MTAPPRPTFLPRLSRFDWAVWIAVVFLCLAIAVVWMGGVQAPLKVDFFSWEGKQVGAGDRYFRVRFNYRVDTETVLPHLAIEPPLPGTISWQGKTLTYTLTEPPIYGTNYQLKLGGVEREFDRRPIEPFVGVFSTRDRAFAYIGIDGEERGRLILKNITDLNRPQKSILTPKDLVVTQFAIYPDSSKILFSAFDRASNVERQQLFTVATGLNQSDEPIGRIDNVLDAENYQNQNFQLSANGKTIAIQRTSRNNPADSGLWVIPAQGDPRPLGIPGEEFRLSPEGDRAIVVQQGGVGIIPLSAEAGSYQFLAGAERSLGFTPDGRGLLLIKPSPGGSQSLVLQDVNGKQQELFQSPNPLLSCAFEPRDANFIYCLIVNTGSQEMPIPAEPYLAAINIKEATEIPLLALPNYREVHLSMSPDGVALLFDQVVAQSATASAQNQGIIDGRVWLFPLPDLEMPKATIQVLPQELNPGFRPQWLP